MYKSVSYRNEEGKPRNKRVPIGKIDPSTGQPIYKPEYLARMATTGAVVETVASDQPFTTEEIRQSSVLEFRAMYLLRSIAQQIGLLNAMLNRVHPIRFVIGEESLRAVTKVRAWNEKHRLHTHVYYHAMKVMKLQKELYTHVTVLKDRAEANPTSALEDEQSRK